MNIYNCINCGEFSTVYQGRNSIELRGTFFEYGESQQCIAYNCHAVGFLFLLMMVINAIVFNHTI